MEWFRQRPIASTIFAVGALLAIAWALFARAGRSSGGGADAQGYAMMSNLPSADAQLAAATQLNLAQLSATDAAQAREAEFALRNAELAVTDGLTRLGYEMSDRNSERQYNLQTYSIASDERLNMASLNANLTARAIDADSMIRAVESQERVQIADMQYDFQAQQAFANAQVAAAKASKKKSIGFGPFSISF